MKLHARAALCPLFCEAVPAHLLTVKKGLITYQMQVIKHELFSIKVHLKRRAIFLNFRQVKKEFVFK